MGRQTSRSRNFKNRNSSGRSNNQAATNTTTTGPLTQLIKDASSYSFSTPLGDIIENVTTMGPFTLPGVMRLSVQHMPGVSLDAFSSINLSAAKLYSKVRYANSGHANYEQPDLMLYTYAISELVAYHAYLCTVYGVAATYSPLNRYTPKVILEALGVNAEDIINNMSDFRYDINQIGYKLQQFVIPQEIRLFTDHMDMYKHVYADSNNPKAQLYVFKPSGFFKYDQMLDTHGGMLRLIEFSDYYTHEDLIALANDMLSRIIKSEDAGIMNGDIMKAYGEKIVTVPSLPEDYTVRPEYNENILDMIKNTTVCGPLASYRNYDNCITQNENGALLFNPYFDCPSVANAHLSVLSKDRLIALDSENPDGAQIYQATRLAIQAYPVRITDEASETHEVCRFYNCGMFYCSGARIYYYSVDPNTLVRSVLYEDFMYGMQIRVNDPSSMSTLPLMRVISMLTKFKKHPMMDVIVNNSSSWFDAGIIGEIDNYTTMSSSALAKIHNAEILANFEIPQ